MPSSCPKRVAVALHVLYLIFHEGYAATAADGSHRADLSAEAIRLTRLVHRSLPDEPEVAGLLALMLLTEARRAARTGPDGELVPVAEQDRGRWDADLIAEGVALIAAALPRGPVGPYRLQAAIAAVHDEAPSAEETDWPRIKGLYELLLQLSDNPVVALNHAVAVAMVEGPARGLCLIAGLESEGRLSGDHRLHAVRGQLLERAGDLAGARVAYRRAAACATGPRHRRHLLARAARLEAFDEE